MTCDHAGGYEVYVRQYDYNAVRVYHCLGCGRHLTLDDLPQNLLRRLYGECLRRAPAPPGPLPPVDFCVAFNGASAALLWRMCWGSLCRTAGTLEGVSFHMVNIDLPDADFGDICREAGVRGVTRPPVPDRIRRRCDAGRVDYDTEWTCEWMVENCGDNRHVVLCHFDLFFVGDFLNRCRALVTPRTGVLGHHCPFLLVNRAAYGESALRFRTGAPLFAVPRRDNPAHFFLACGGDRRVTPGLPQTGFEMGELLALELNMLGWETDTLREEQDRYFCHLGGGGRVRGGPEFDDIRRRAGAFIAEYGL